MRDPGYYWLKHNTFKDAKPWMIGEWHNGYWWIPGYEYPFEDFHFLEIGYKVEEYVETV